MPPPFLPPVLDESSLKPNSVSAFLVIVHAFEYAISIDCAAARRERCVSTRRSSSATPGPKHLRAPKMRTEITGCSFSAIAVTPFCCFSIVYADFSLL